MALARAASRRPGVRGRYTPEVRPGVLHLVADGTQAFGWKLGKDGQFTQLASATQRFQWNADGTALYVEAVRNEVRNVWRVRVNAETLEWVAAEQITAGAGQDVGAALAPFGGRMAYSVQQQSTRLWAFPLDASAARMTVPGTPFTPEDGRAQSMSLSPDGRLAAFTLVRAGRSRSELLVTDLDTDKTEVYAPGAFGTAWSPDSRTLAYQLARPDVTDPKEWALAVREVGGSERLIRRWTKDSYLVPTGWTRDGKFILGSYASPPFTGTAKLALWPLSPSPAETERLLIDEPRRNLWQGSVSPNGHWLTFVATSVEDVTRAGMYVRARGIRFGGVDSHRGDPSVGRQAALGAERETPLFHLEPGLAVFQPLGRQVRSRSRNPDRRPDSAHTVRYAGADNFLRRSTFRRSASRRAAPS